MANLYAKVIEDDGGGLRLYVMDQTDTCIYAHYGYEYRPGALTEDLKALIEDDSVADWEGCEENVAEAWEELEIDNIGYTKIAAVTDGELKLYPHKMGAAGQKEFYRQNGMALRDIIANHASDFGWLEKHASFNSDDWDLDTEEWQLIKKTDNGEQVYQCPTAEITFSQSEPIISIW